MSENEVSLIPGGELRILFDKESDDITIVSPGGHKIVLNDRTRELVINDVNANSIRMAPEGVTITSAGNVSLQADQKLSIKGGLGVDIQSNEGDVSVDALNIKEQAQMSYSAQGSMTAEVRAGAELILNGAMVMIN
ncbi:hypothetical protein [Gilvimarinus algae]|uniref:DUF2345 domain-containing protein n=1 Tax=Gilvimarinus algae TaxID=3058037 RepID=A0ABT8TG11_9GAMM|nr:hypothetical protein [Gilvimarinus sp. SDUM040014]MDO3383015.1 hypothetical protein [Gilvimarinus sp. SDUM040014]